MTSADADVDVGAGAERAAERGLDWASGRVAMAAVGLLVLAVATDRLGIRVGGLNLRIELIVAGLIVAWAVLRSGGDVLSGSIAAFLAQGLIPADAASLAVFVGSRAAARLEERYGTLGVVAGDLPVAIAEELGALERMGG